MNVFRYSQSTNRFYVGFWRKQNCIVNKTLPHGLFRHSHIRDSVSKALHASLTYRKSSVKIGVTRQWRASVITVGGKHFIRRHMRCQPEHCLFIFTRHLHFSRCVLGCASFPKIRYRGTIFHRKPKLMQTIKQPVPIATIARKEKQERGSFNFKPRYTYAPDNYKKDTALALL